jgi:hypothetical protein
LLFNDSDSDSEAWRQVGGIWECYNGGDGEWLKIVVESGQKKMGLHSRIYVCYLCQITSNLVLQCIAYVV